MPGYTKLFNSILASTIWREDDKTRIVWITMLAMATKQGIVEASLPGLADFARVNLEDCEKSLARLSAPDAYSRSKISDGRRITEIEGGWLLLNHKKYRDTLTSDERREYNRVKQAEYRAKTHHITDTVSNIANVSNVNDKSAECRHTTPAPSPTPAPEKEDQNQVIRTAAQESAWQSVLKARKKKGTGKYRVRVR